MVHAARLAKTFLRMSPSGAGFSSPTAEPSPVSSPSKPASVGVFSIKK